ncbi:MAG TPA: hypothetical protein VM686_32860, partial [Polyangiaceae bacterium]|nr:hypothetical protein [Polyangiaceae bacterium]
MRTLRGLLALATVVGVAQSCTNDFDKFDVGVGGATSVAGTTSRGGTTVNTGGTIARGGTGSSAGGDTGVAGVDASAGAESMAGAPSGGGAGGAPEGCQEAIDSDVLHCGECERACDSSGVSGLECSSGTCTSSCAPGFANCSQPALGPDDGCETDVSADTAQCGGCDNACPTGFACSSGQCACDNSGDCGNGGGVDCVSGQCECDSVLCRPGEQCRAAGGDRFCSCNDSTGPGCAANEFCCAAGCTDVESSALDCGACGRSCTSGFECVSGACECDSAEDCGGAPVAGDAGAGG